MSELNANFFPKDSPIAQNQGKTNPFKFDWENEAGVISQSKIRNATIGTAQITAFNFNQGTGGTITLGGTANGNGVMQVLNSSGGTVVTANNLGIVVNNGRIVINNSDGNPVVDSDGIVSTNSFFSDSLIDFAEHDTSNTTPTDVPDAELTFVLDRETSVLVFFYVEGYNDSDDGIQVRIYDTLLASELITTAFLGMNETIVDWDETTGLINSVDYFVSTEPSCNISTFSLAAGTHTLKLQFNSQTTGTSKLFVSSLGYLILGT